MANFLYNQELEAPKPESRVYRDIPNNILLQNAGYNPDYVDPRLVEEINRRIGAERFAGQAGLVDLGIGSLDSVVSLASKIPNAPSALTSFSTALNKANPYINIASNLAQGAATVRSRTSPYQANAVAPRDVIVTDVGEGLIPLAGGFIGQTLFGGEASHARTMAGTRRNNAVFANNPSEAYMRGVKSAEWGRNMVSGVGTSALNRAQNAAQERWEHRYYGPGGLKETHSPQWLLDASRQNQGNDWVDYNRAQAHVPWPVKLYYGARVASNDWGSPAEKKAMDDFKEAGKPFEQIDNRHAQASVMMSNPRAVATMALATAGAGAKKAYEAMPIAYHMMTNPGITISALLNALK